MGGLEYLVEKAFSCVGIAAGAQHEGHRGSRRLDGPVEVVPLLFNLDVGFIDAV
jgi:hypothetical protein